MSPFGPENPRLPLIGRNAAAERFVRERTWVLEQRIEQLERERRDLERILRGLGEGVLAVDRAGIVVHANPAAIAMLGLDAATCFGSHMFVAVPHPAVCDVLEDVMRGEGRVMRELVVEGPAGADTVLQASVRSLRKAGVEDGEPEGAVAVVRDVTELRRLERARHDFFGNVSHELKTPVTAIRGAIETIVDDPAMSSEDRDRFLDGARRHSMRLGALVADLLSLARLEGDPQALQHVPLELPALAQEVVDAAQDEAARRGLTVALVVDGDAGSLQVDGDEEALRQAVGNLVDNAIAHSEAGGHVEVRVAADDAAIVLVVADDGAGIPPESIDRIFERFYRVDAARSRARGGTGIGLSIVKHVAQVHGGSIAVTSDLGAGSAFTLRLPVSRPSARGTSPAT